MKKFVTSFLSFFLISLISVSQVKTHGVPFVKNYSPSDFKGGSSTWAIIQDDRGIMYFGNESGIMEFDGSVWKFIAPDVSAIRFVKDSNGKIYVGCRGDFGYLWPDKNGEMEFVSLKEKIPEQYKDISNFWNITTKDSTVYFSMNKGKVYVYKNDTINVLELSDWGGYIGCFNGDIFYEYRDGLGIIKNDTIKLVDGGAALEITNIRNIFEYAEDSLLVVTRSHGFFIYSDNKLTEFKLPVSDFLKKNQIYFSTKIDSEHYAFGTITAGVLIMDKEGNAVSHINQDGGLQSNDHCAIYTDMFGNVWSGLEYGVSNIFINCPLSVYNKQMLLPNSNIMVLDYGSGYLYAGTSQGVFYKKWADIENPLDENLFFTLIEENSGRKIWSLVINNDEIISGSSNNGTFHTAKGKTEEIYKEATVALVRISDEMILSSLEHDKGLVLFKKKNGKWESQLLTDKFPFSQMVIDKDTNIWSFYDGHIIKLKFGNNFKDTAKVVIYDSLNNVPEFDNIGVFKFEDEVLFSTEEGTYKIENDKFMEYDEFNSAIGDSVFVLQIKQDMNGKHWYWAIQGIYEIIGSIEKDGDKFAATKILKPMLKFESIITHAFLPIDDKNLLIGTGSCIAHLNPDITTNVDLKFQTLIRKVQLIGNSDSIIFGGAYIKEGKLTSIQTKEDIPVIPFEFNAVRFDYSAIYFEDVDKIEYQYRLLGFNDEWSDWSVKTAKEYTYLPNGKYIFEVRARNIYDSISTVASYEIVISPPWYKTKLAYVSYVLLLALLVFVIVKLSVRKVEKEKIKLEKIVKERTAEIVLQKEEILSQNEELVVQKEEILTQRDEIEKQRDLLINKNEYIEQQSAKITSSITYASRIQKALLPHETEFKNTFSDYFIFFKPKDIVSGDFYWMKRIDNYVLIAVADCTGHGVPGAFMSMLGIAFLNEIVTKREITQASQVLEEMRMQVKKSLNQTGDVDENKDGMDMAFITMDLNNKTLQFSGAHNPLYIIRNDELIIYSGDKQPVSIYPIEKPFENHEIKIEDNDIIYMFSDGFADQLGGEKYQKFMYKRFKKLFMDIYKLPMNEQKTIIAKTYQNWIDQTQLTNKKNIQVDDVLIVGLKI